jgi:hypothetical protein
MSQIYLDWNLGLGDAIVCCGLVRELAKRNDRIILPCWARNERNVRHMFSDLRNIEVEVVATDRSGSRPGFRTVSIGMHASGFGELNWDQRFYAFAEVDFSRRWDSFDLPLGKSDIPVPSEPFALICERGSDGIYPLHGLNHPNPVRLERSPLLFDWVPMMREAEEIHCIDSAPMNLVESVPTKGKLFFHKYARGGVLNLRKSWVTLA